MVKFFLPEAKQNPERRKTDYRKIIYKHLLQLIKIKHLKYLSTVVKEIKDNPSPTQQKMSEMKGYKEIKKRQMKLLTLYIMGQVLMIQNLAPLESETHLQKIDKESISKECEERTQLKSFFQRVIKSKAYLQKIEKLGNFCDGINKKKHQTKERNKERKNKKFQRKKNRSQFQIADLPQQEKQIREQNAKVPDNVAKTKKINKETQLFKAKEKDNKSDKPSKKFSVTNHEETNIKSSKRTEFVKKGRNKVKDDKKKKKLMFKNQPVNHGQEQNQPKPSQSPIMHPSWSAKKEEKSKMFITQFKGTKIAL